LEKDVEKSSIVSTILRKIQQNKIPLVERLQNKLEAKNEEAVENWNKVVAIRDHRRFQENVRKLSEIIKNLGKNPFTTSAANFMVQSSGVDLTHMEEIIIRGKGIFN